VAVDLLAGPALALRGSQTKTTVSPGAATTSQYSQDLLPRAIVSTRLNFIGSDRSIFRAFVGLDGELGPSGTSSGTARGTPADTPRGTPAGALGPGRGDAAGLPIWTVGLALGATVGTP
jgi:hypothetical protein